jgi:hypothetical protein
LEPPSTTTLPLLLLFCCVTIRPLPSPPTADGVWCQAKVGDKDGWIRKVALRQNKWPILTFTDGCG